MVGANFANFINVSSSTSLPLGMVALNGVSEAVAVEGGVLNGNGIVKSMAFILDAAYFVRYLIVELCTQATARRHDSCAGFLREQPRDLMLTNSCSRLGHRG